MAFEQESAYTPPSVVSRRFLVVITYFVVLLSVTAAMTSAAAGAEQQPCEGQAFDLSVGALEAAPIVSKNLEGKAPTEATTISRRKIKCACSWTRKQKIGLGIGASIGMLLLAMFFYERGRRSKEEELDGGDLIPTRRPPPPPVPPRVRRHHYENVAIAWPSGPRSKEEIEKSRGPLPPLPSQGTEETGEDSPPVDDNEHQAKVWPRDRESPYEVIDMPTPSTGRRMLSMFKIPSPKAKRGPDTRGSPPLQESSGGIISSEVQGGSVPSTEPPKKRPGSALKAVLRGLKPKTPESRRPISLDDIRVDLPIEGDDDLEPPVTTSPTSPSLPRRTGTRTSPPPSRRESTVPPTSPPPSRRESAVTLPAVPPRPSRRKLP